MNGMWYRIGRGFERLETVACRWKRAAFRRHTVNGDAYFDAFNRGYKAGQRTFKVIDRVWFPPPPRGDR